MGNAPVRSGVLDKSDSSSTSSSDDDVAVSSSSYSNELSSSSLSISSSNNAFCCCCCSQESSSSLSDSSDTKGGTSEEQLVLLLAASNGQPTCPGWSPTWRCSRSRTGPGCGCRRWRPGMVPRGTASPGSFWKAPGPSPWPSTGRATRRWPPAPASGGWSWPAAAAALPSWPARGRVSPPCASASMPSRSGPSTDRARTCSRRPSCAGWKGAEPGGQRCPSPGLYGAGPGGHEGRRIFHAPETFPVCEYGAGVAGS